MDDSVRWSVKVSAGTDEAVRTYLGRRRRSARALSRLVEEAAAKSEERRRNRALFARYTSADDIDKARQHALEENRKMVSEIESRIAGIKKRQIQNTKELEFYTGKNKPPARLEHDIQNAEIDLKAQQEQLEAKKKEVDVINAKYDEDKRRFLELTAKK